MSILRNHQNRFGIFFVTFVSLTSGLVATACSQFHRSKVRSEPQNQDTDPSAPGGLKPGAGAVIVQPIVSSTEGNTNSSDNCSSSDDDPVPVLEGQRITKHEYNNVIRDIFELHTDFSASFSEPARGQAGYSTESLAQNISKEIVLDFYSAAGSVTEAVVELSKQSKGIFSINCGVDETCIKNSIERLLSKAFRRTARADEVSSYHAMFKVSKRNTYIDKMRTVIKRVLLSPHFLFRMPGQDEPTSKSAMPVESSTETPLSHIDLASRLSFFIWGSIPDKTLIDLAEQGKLHEEQVLTEQVLRLLADERSRYLANRFGEQWLELDRLTRLSLDKVRFPSWGPQVKDSLRKETLMFFENIIKSNATVLDLIHANYTYADFRVASIYGLKVAEDGSFSRIGLGENRRGILSHPGLLAMNSGGDHTTPVLRGKWLLEKFLCAAPPPPPPDIPKLAETATSELKAESKIRQRLEAHRLTDSSCFACHNTMDPIGLSFENFDSMGYYRTKYLDDTVVDPSGVLPTGEKLSNYNDLNQTLSKDERFPICFAAHLASFAQGRNMLDAASRCEAKSIAASSIGTDKKFSDAVIEIVLRKSFRYRKTQ